MSERTLPHSLEAERSVIGAILIENTAMDAAGVKLKAEHFYRLSHGQTFGAMVSLLERGIACDYVTVSEELKKRGQLESAGGPSFIASLTDGVPRSTNVEYYARIVKEKAILRRLIVAASRVVDAAYDASDEPQAVLADAEAVFLEISGDAVPGDPVFADDLSGDTRSLLDRIHTEKRPLTGLPTGFRELDGYTRGMQKGNLIVIGGRPGEGKSALALQIGLQVAEESSVLLFSMEMSREEIATRAISMLGSVDHHRMMLGRLTDPEQQRVGKALITLGARQFGVDDSPSLTPFQIRSKARRVKAKRGLALIIVDYLQLLSRPKHAHSREEAVADNSRALKVLAGELEVPVVVLSQLNRTVEGRTDKKPTMSDLRESGAIEQDANVILLIYKPTPSPQDVFPPVELLIAKQRNGPQHVTVDMTFTGEHMTFAERPWR